MSILPLFVNFLWVGLFSVGGGYAAVPLIESRIVQAAGWLSMEEFANLMTIAEMTPGPIVINAATFVGLRVGGVPGAIAASMGSVLPSVLLVSLLAWVYRRFQGASAVQGVLGSLRPAVVALIASAGLGILKLVVVSGGSVKWIESGLFLAAFVALRKWKTSPIATMLACGVLGLLMHLLFG